MNKAVAKTAPNIPVTEVMVESYQLVVGFEVNHPNAYVNGIHILNNDYGHAFFYLTKNGMVKKFFSFGPVGSGKDGWLNKGNSRNSTPNAWNTGAPKKDGYATSREGTATYPISEVTKNFRFTLDAHEFEVILKETERIIQQIYARKQDYTAWINDTCAETARDIIKKGYPSIPEGSGAVDAGVGVKITAVNPYRWYHNMKSMGLSEMVTKGNKMALDRLNDAMHAANNYNRRFSPPPDPLL